jgi:hypothetical protein
MARKMPVPEIPPKQSQQPELPDMLARGRRVALNFADAVAQRCRDEAIHDDNDAQ